MRHPPGLTWNLAWRIFGDPIPTLKEVITQAPPSPPAMCSEPTGFSRAMGQRGHHPGSRPISLAALCGDGAIETQQASCEPRLWEGMEPEWELLPAAQTGHDFNTLFWNSAFNSKCLPGQIWSLESNYSSRSAQNRKIKTHTLQIEECSRPVYI